MTDWTNEMLINFVELYQSEPILWDPKHIYHKHKAKINDAWNRISEIMNIPMEELKNKKNSIMATFRGHLRKKKASIKSGAGQDDVYKPIWFLYNQMESFLGNINECNTTLNTEQKNDSQVDENARENEEISESTTQTQPVQRTNKARQTSRRRENPPELEEAKQQMKEAFSALNNVINKKNEEDECDLFAKILAKKLRKLPEEDREILMYEINGLYIKHYRRTNSPSSTFPTISHSSSSSRGSPSFISFSEPELQISNRPLSSCTSYSEPSQAYLTYSDFPVPILHMPENSNIIDQPSTSAQQVKILSNEKVKINEYPCIIDKAYCKALQSSDECYDD